MMPHTTIRINITPTDQARSRVMIIYTGGTFGMAYNAEGTLIPFNFSNVGEQLPSLRNLFLDLTVVSFDQPVDSSNISPRHWQTLGQIIFDNYDQFDGFVVLHGTDTMAYTASALSFMLQGLSKPVIFTGAQLPISQPRSDARENLITALEIASTRSNGAATVPEVCIFFDYQLWRGNRARKKESMHFDAFESGNYPPLARAGVKLDFNTAVIRSPSAGEKLRLLSRFDTSVSILKLFPGIGEQAVKAILSTPGLRGLILETFGSGNAPTDPWLVDVLQDAISRGILIVNISQCPGGMVIQGRYETSKQLAQIGVTGGSDMTTEAALTKLMLLLVEYGSEKTKRLISMSLAGELTG
jgi:L-asparaginase